MYKLEKNKSYGINIYSFSSNTEILFHSFVTDFSDDYKTSWTPQEVYGRMDPIYSYKNTVRKISIAFDVPSQDLDEAKEHGQNVDILIKSLYPVYEESKNGSTFMKGAATLQSPPLFKILFSNLIVNAGANEYLSARQSGLMGFIDGFNFKPDLQSGFLFDSGKMYAKLFKVNFSFSVIHEHPLGNVVNNGIHYSRMQNSSKETFSHKYDERNITSGQGNIADSQKNPSNAVTEAAQSLVSIQ